MAGLNHLRLLLVDFDGVLSNGRFYRTDNPADKQLAEAAVSHIFTKENSAVLNDWMRGLYTYHDIHVRVERQTGIAADVLDALLVESIKNMPLNQPMIAFVKKLRAMGVTVSLFTNNMDIFDQISRAHHQLDSLFDFIYSSSAYGALKLESEVLLQKACDDAGAPRTQVALVDDSLSSFTAAKHFGIKPFLYKNYEMSQSDFEHWLEQTFTYSKEGAL